ncbi:MAG: M3 family metallopeptidase [Candidatus Heimdallarchaeota archaeon]
MTEEIPFDLTEIFSSIDDPAIDKTLEQLDKMAADINSKYQGKIKEFDASKLFELLLEYEEFLVLLNEMRNYAGFSFYGNMTDEKAQSLNNKHQAKQAKRQQQLTFISLELGELIHTKPELLSDNKLQNYKHFLTKLKNTVPHQLSEAEERLIIEKDQFGVSAWEQLRSKWASTREFEITIDGKKTPFHIGMLGKFSTNENRSVRKNAYEIVYKNVNEDHEIYSFALRNIFNDWVTISKRRKYKKPIDSSLRYNEINQVILDNMFDTIEKNAELYRRVLKIKAKLLGLPKLAPYDHNAPLPGLKEKKYSWKDAKEIITQSFAVFDKNFVEIANDMFDRNHIDAPPRKGKTPGAFCSTWYKGQSGFILQSFNEDLNGVTTLAHELGHAIHAYYMVKEQTILNTRFPAVSAETASFFGELLLIEKLLTELDSKEEKIDILLRLTSRIGHVIFGLTPMYWFETDVYEAIERGEFLDSKAITNYWVTNRDKIYGDAIEEFKEVNASWSLVPHYYMANFRYYNYPYIFAQLFVYALYQQYLQEKESFIPKFKKILAAGGSLSPQDLGKMIGLDITKPEFWNLGMKQYEYFVLELEKLVD